MGSRVSRNWRVLAGAALLILLMTLLGACQAEAETDQAAAPIVAAETLPAPAATLASPLLSTNIAPTAVPTDPPAFSLVEVTPTAAPEAAKSAQAVEAKTLPTATMTPPAEPTATPEPTFTPPALPFTSPNEHYWLRRPIAEGGQSGPTKRIPTEARAAAHCARITALSSMSLRARKYWPPPAARCFFPAQTVRSSTDRTQISMAIC